MPYDYNNNPDGSDYNNDADYSYNNIATIVRAASELSPSQFVQSIAPGYGNAPSGGGAPSAPSGGAQPAQQETAIAQALSRLAGDQDRRRREFWQKLKTDLEQKLATTQNQAPRPGTIPVAGRAYDMEKLDPRHRMGTMLLQCLRAYDDRAPPQPFFEWLDGLPEFERMTLLRGFKNPGTASSEDILLPSVVRAFARGVAYLDGGTRRTYRVGVRGGMMFQNSVPFDSGNLKTVFNGPGWAIYVLSSVKNLYAGSHVFGEFHHSSFMSGAAVTCAGEMQVSHGRLSILTAKSGHYRTPQANFVAGIDHLTQKGIDPSSYKVRVYQLGSANPSQPTAAQFLANQSQYTVWR